MLTAASPDKLLKLAFRVEFSEIQIVIPVLLLKLIAVVRFPEIQTTALLEIVALGEPLPLIVTVHAEHCE